MGHYDVQKDFENAVNYFHESWARVSENDWQNWDMEYFKESVKYLLGQSIYLTYYLK